MRRNLLFCVRAGGRVERNRVGFDRQHSAAGRRSDPVGLAQGYRLDWRLPTLDRCGRGVAIARVFAAGICGLDRKSVDRDVPVDRVGLLDRGPVDRTGMEHLDRTNRSRRGTRPILFKTISAATDLYVLRVDGRWLGVAMDFPPRNRVDRVCRKFDYVVYVGLIALAFLSKVISFAFWGRIAEESGAAKVLWFGGIGLVPLASLWIVSTNLIWLAIIQILSGIAWAAYELGFFLMFFETLPAKHRTRLLTYHNFANTLAICAGALAGAAILAYWGTTSQTYYYLFGLSSAGRLLCLGLLVGAVLPKHSLKSIGMRVLSIRPGAGSVTAPIIASAEE